MERKKLGILLSTSQQHPNKKTAVGLSRAALAEGHEVYLYLVDDGTENLEEPEIQELSRRGAHLFICAYGAQRRAIPTSEKAAFCGLVVLSDLVKGCNPFVTLN